MEEMEQAEDKGSTAGGMCVARRNKLAAAEVLLRPK